MQHPPVAPGATLHPLSTWWRGGRVTGQSRTTPGTIRAALARQRVRNAAPSPQTVVSPHLPSISPGVGMWQMQDHPGAPGTARQESTRIIVSTYDGGNATQPRAPGHERPRAALRAARHGRLSAASTAPGADVPPATPAGAPGQYCLSAAPRAPGHGRPLAIAAGVPGHDRLSAALRAPGADAALAASAMPLSHRRPSAAPIATAPSPAGLRRLRQVILPRTPATPNTLIYPHSRSTASSLRHKPQPIAIRTPDHHADSPSLAGKGPGVRSNSYTTPPPLQMLEKGPGVRSTSHQVHPAIQVPPHPRSCSAARRGFLQHPSRAPPRDGNSPPLELAPGEGTANL